MNDDISRRTLLRTGLGFAVAGVLAACSDSNDSNVAGATTAPTTTPSTSPTTGAAGVATTLPATPACGDDDATPALTEGPYFTPNSPERTTITDGAPGTELVLSGTVVTTACQPVGKALVDFWQADGNGEYDNAGYRLRGHQFADAQGRYTLTTVVPGLYPGRTRHIHVKVQAPGGPVLTSQLFFPGEAQNAADSIYREECLITMDGADAGAFTFVLEA